jgi:hypothetical protein
MAGIMQPISGVESGVGQKRRIDTLAMCPPCPLHIQ